MRRKALIFLTLIINGYKNCKTYLENPDQGYFDHPTGKGGIVQYLEIMPQLSQSPY
jgi:hypothetical protein